MILIPSVLVLFNKPDDNFFPWHVSHENKGVVAFFLYVLPVYLVFATLIAFHFYGHIFYNSFFFHNPRVEKYIKEANSFDPDDDELLCYSRVHSVQENSGRQ